MGYRSELWFHPGRSVHRILNHLLFLLAYTRTVNTTEYMYVYKTNQKVSANDKRSAKEFASVLLSSLYM
jgi:hypothetical protein